MADYAREIADLRQRLSTLEATVANGGVPVGPGPTFGPNVLTNGDMESGIASWPGRFLFGPVGSTASVETVAPLDGVRSLRVDEVANALTFIGWLPSGNTSAPVVGSDVFFTTGGDVWLFTGTMMTSVATAHAQLIGVTGPTPVDAVNLAGATTTWTLATDIPLAAGVPGTFVGEVTVPPGHNYIGFVLAPTSTLAIPTSAWTWWFDDASLQVQI